MLRFAYLAEPLAAGVSRLVQRPASTLDQPAYAGRSPKAPKIPR
jgi:hypothetical protein